MNDPAILFVKPRAISAKDKKALQAAGVVVIEVENPGEIKFTRAHAELSGTEMLTAALKAIATNTYSNTSKQKFGELVIEAFLAKTHQAVIDPSNLD